LETDPEFQSSDRRQNATFAADLLHRYFKNSRMLGVREVAERLRVCTATVYKLCASGALEHVRIVNSIASRRRRCTRSWRRRRDHCTLGDSDWPTIRPGAET
jgi:hypothetical protein